MLTDEDRSRIKDEEQYRVTVRAELQSKASKRNLWLGLIFGIMVAVLSAGAFGAYFVSNLHATGSSHRPVTKADTIASPSTTTPSTTTPTLPKFRWVPITQQIVDSGMTVQAGGYAQFPFTITDDMVDARVTGNFDASGGRGNDIEAAIADPSNFLNWINGHQARVFWGTAGRETTGSFDVALTPGMYYIALSNRFSAFAPKQVILRAQVTYHKKVLNNDLQLPLPPVRTESN
jgi:hypothetical protein